MAVYTRDSSWICQFPISLAVEGEAWSAVADRATLAASPAPGPTVPHVLDTPSTGACRQPCSRRGGAVRA